MNSVEMLDMKEQLRVKGESIISGAEKEMRKLTDDETVELDNIQKEIREINDELRKINDNNLTRKMEKFSLLKTINCVVNNKPFDERSQSLINEGVKEMRKSGLSFSGQIQLPIEERADILATVVTSGMEAVQTDKLNILEPLRANLVMAQAGANVMTGLVGNISIPLYDGTTVTWEDEVATAKDGAGKFSEVELSPKRLTAVVEVSKQFLLQDSVSAEEMLMNDIVKAITNQLEATILGDEAGSNKKPAGLFYNAPSATLTFEGTVGMEAELENANVNGEITYIVSPTAKAALRTAKKSDIGFVMENGEINGIKTLCTSNAKGVVAGDFSDYVIAQWGAVDLLVDPFTKAADGKVRIIVNAYFDAKPRRATSFVAGVVTKD